MGGVAGHLAHMQENLDFTFGELKSVLKSVVSGEMPTVEKVDGQNIFFSFYVDPETGGVRTARNKGDLKKGGMTPEEFSSKWKGHPAEGAFVNGFNAIRAALDRVGETGLQEIFAADQETNQRFVNAEIIFTGNPNVISYAADYIIMHNLQEFDADGSLVDVQLRGGQFDQLVKAVDDAQSDADDQVWSVVGPQVIKLQDLSATEVYDDFVSSIDALGFTDGDSIGDFVEEKLRDTIVEQLPISPRKQEQLLERIMGIANNADASSLPQLADLKKGLSQDVQRRISAIATKTNVKKVISQVTKPIELAIHDLAVEVLRDLASALTGGHDEEVERLRAELEDAKEKINSARDADSDARRKMLEQQLEKLGSSDNIASSMEGIVFEHPPGSKALYKLTGAFAPLNQIIGRARRIPTSKNESFGGIMMKENTLRNMIRKMLLERIVDFEGEEFDIPDADDGDVFGFDSIKNIVRYGVAKPSEDTPSRAVDVESGYQSVLSSDPDLADLLGALGLETEEEMLDRLATEQPDMFEKNEDTGKVGRRKGVPAKDYKAAVKSDQLQAAFPMKERNAIKQIVIAAYQANPQGFKDEFINSFRATAAPTGDQSGDFAIPPAFKILADYTLTGGKSVGAGEFVIPFMFKEAQINPGGNAIHDVKIGALGYHVKADNPGKGIRFGPRKGGAAAGSDMARDLANINEEDWTSEPGGLDGGEYNNLLSLEIGQELLAKIICKYSKILKDAREAGSPITTRSTFENLEPETIYNVWSTEAASRATHAPDQPGYGTVFYHQDKLFFVPEKDLRLKQTTQLGRYLLGNLEVGKSVLGKIKACQLSESKSVRRHRDIEVIKEALAEQRGDGKQIALIPMAAKPYHAGHHALVTSAAADNDEVLLYVSLSDRKRKGELTVLGSDMAQIWKEEIEKILPSNVMPVYGGSPVRKVFEVLANAEERLVAADYYPHTYVVYSDPVDTARNYSPAAREKYFPTMYAQGQVRFAAEDNPEAFTRGEGTPDVSGTAMRSALQCGDSASFEAGLPDGIDKSKVYNTLCPFATNESVFRQRVKNTIRRALLKEQEHSLYSTFVQPFADVATVATLSAQDVLAASFLNLKLWTTWNPERQEKALQDYDQTKSKIMDKMKPALDRVNDRLANADADIIAMAVAPGWYFGQLGLETAYTAAKTPIDFLQGAGLEIPFVSALFDGQYDPPDSGSGDPNATVMEKMRNLFFGEDAFKESNFRGLPILVEQGDPKPDSKPPMEKAINDWLYQTGVQEKFNEFASEMLESSEEYVNEILKMSVPRLEIISDLMAVDAESLEDILRVMDRAKELQLPGADEFESKLAAAADDIASDEEFKEKADDISAETSGSEASTEDEKQMAQKTVAAEFIRDFRKTAAEDAPGLQQQALQAIEEIEPKGSNKEAMQSSELGKKFLELYEQAKQKISGAYKQASASE